MGYSNNRKNFTPDNDENTLYIECEKKDIPFLDLMSQIKDYFGEDVNFEEISISSENIHTRCIGYDLHDGGDYDNYLIITREK